MADQVMSTRTSGAIGSILARDLGLMPSDYGTYRVKAGLATMKPGMFVTTFGETGEHIDILADADEYCTGIVLSRLDRAYSTDGSIIDTIDTVFAAEDEVRVLHLTGGRAIVWAWLTGLDITANDEGTGLARRGAPVYVPDATSTAASATNRTPGAGMTFGANVAIDYMTGMTLPYIKIGTLVQDATILDSAATPVGIIVKVQI